MRHSSSEYFGCPELVVEELELHHLAGEVLDRADLVEQLPEALLDEPLRTSPAGVRSDSGSGAPRGSGRSACARRARSRGSTNQRTDSMKNRSLAEERRGREGRAHRRSRIPRSVQTVKRAAGRARPPPGRRDPGQGRRETGRLLDLDLGALLLEGGLDLLGLVAWSTPSLTALGAASTRSLASLRPRPVSSRTTLMTGILFGPISVRVGGELGLLLGRGGASAQRHRRQAAAATATGAAAVTP